MGDSRGFQERVQDGIILKEQKIRRVLQVEQQKRPALEGPRRYNQANVGEYLYQKGQLTQAKKE